MISINIILLILLPMVVTALCFCLDIGWPAVKAACYEEGSVASKHPKTFYTVIFFMSMLFTPVCLFMYIVPSYSHITYTRLVEEFSKSADEE